jgi:hypothetical protein
VSSDRELGRRLRDVAVPGEHEAEERSWEIVRAAYAERAPVRRTHGARRLALAVAGGAAVLAIGLSPAGAKVGDLVSEMGEAVGIGKQDARPALRSLPAAGELLVESGQGPWIVREDGSKRLLGDYGEATWSPRGLFVAAADGRELIAVEPGGEVRWTITAPGPLSDVTWGGIGFDTRIAYRSGSDLRVVAGDGTGDRLVARDVAPVAPAWLSPPPESKLDPARRAHALAYLDRRGRVEVVDADTGTAIGDRAPYRTRVRDLRSDRVLSPTAPTAARLERRRGRSTLSVAGDGKRRVLFSARGVLTGPTWSPDGRWLLVGWPDADQWLFIRTDRPQRVIAFDRISEQFDPGDTGRAGFPRVAGWLLPQR